MKIVHRVLTGPGSALFNTDGDCKFFSATYKAAQPREWESSWPTNYTISSQYHAILHSQLHFYNRHYTIKQNEIKNRKV